MVSAPLSESQFVDVRPVSNYRVRADYRYLLQTIRTTLPLALTDVLTAVFGVGLGAVLLHFIGASPVNHYRTVLLLLTVCTVAVNTSLGLYPGVGLHPARELQKLVTGITIVCGLLFGGALAPLDFTSPYLPLFAIVWVVSTLGCLPIRSTVRGWLSRQSWWGFPAMVLGGGDNLDNIAQRIQHETRSGIRLLGFSASNDVYWSSEFREPTHCKYLGPLAECGQIARKNRVFWGFVLQTTLGERSLAEFLEEHDLSFPEIVLVNDTLAVPGMWNETIAFRNGIGGVHVTEHLLLPIPKFVKRSFDLIVSCGALIVLAIPMAIIALCIRLTSPGPIFFSHKRIGLRGLHFNAWKFRTMAVNGDEILKKHLAENAAARAEWEADQKLKDDPRVSKLGAFLRSSSLDELPQLWNVLVGEMSLVGPRPIVDNEVEKYAEVFTSYLRARPGITGLWQISGRNNTTYSERVAFDQYYVSNWSPWLDLYILGRTIKTVLLREGAY